MAKNTIAVMQPYFFPYIGYYQLAYAVDEFVFFDDVNFIKKGYINRNSILLNNAKHDFSIPIKNVSQNRKINEHTYVNEWDNFLKTLTTAYKRAPFFENIFPLVRSTILDANDNVAVKNSLSLKNIFNYLNITRKWTYASDLKIRDELKAQARILEICKQRGATDYRNAIGGKSLYSAPDFKDAGVELKFVRTGDISYSQYTKEFMPNLSMIDVLMFCSVDQITDLLRRYTLEA